MTEPAVPPRTGQGLTEQRLVGSGFLLMAVPVSVIFLRPEAHDVAAFYLRVMTALGAALIGASLPGFLDLRLPRVRATGALGIFVVIYVFNPPATVEEIADPASLVDAPPAEVPQPSTAVHPTSASLPGPVSAPATRSPADADGAPAAALTGWAYLGTFRDGRWIEPRIRPPDGLPTDPGPYPVAAAINVRASRPRFPMYESGELLGRANRGDRLRVLEFDRLGKSRVWARVELLGRE